MSQSHYDKVVDPKVQSLLQRLRALQSDWPSEPELDNADGSMLEALLQMANANDARQSKHTDASVNFTLLLCACFGTALIMPDAVKMTLLLLAVVFLVLAAWQGILAARLSNTRPEYVLYALTKTRDPRALPALLQALQRNHLQHPELTRAIWRQLPFVTEEHVGLLSAEQRTRLWLLVADKWLGGVRPDLVGIAVGLQALCNTGDQNTLTGMKDLARNSMFSDAPQPVIKIVQSLVPVMEARLKRQEVPATLLRAADMPALLPETLLRPAHTATPEPPEQLLRAGIAEQKPG